MYESQLPDEFITNFNPKDLQVYVLALLYYSRAEPAKARLMRISNYACEPAIAGDCSLWYYGQGDLSKFWRIYDSIRNLRDSLQIEIGQPQLTF